METILVTGGTGHLGRALVRELAGRGKRLRLLTRRPRSDPAVEWALADLATGEGVPQAMAGVDAVIHAATFSPMAQRGSMALSDLFSSPSAVDVDGARRLIEAAGTARVRHFLFVSIAGLEHSPLPYSKVKLAAERLVRASSLPWSVVPAAPFNPVDVADVAPYLADCFDEGPLGMRPAIGGPELMPLADYARQFQQSRGFHRPILPLPASKTTAIGLGMVDPAQGRAGSVTWRDWLASHPADDEMDRARIAGAP